MKLRKEIALRVCKACPGAWTVGCSISDIECGSEYIDPPKCLRDAMNAMKKSDPRSISGISGISEDMENEPAQNRVPPATPEIIPAVDGVSERIRPGGGVQLPWEWDGLDGKIIEAILLHYSKNGIARFTGGARSTVSGRLNRMMKHEIIREIVQVIGGRSCKRYILTEGWAQRIIRNEGEVAKSINQQSERLKFTWHGCVFKSRIISGYENIPDGHHKYKPNGWEGKVFYGEDHTFRVTPNHVIVDINLNLSADTEDNLKFKYFQLATSYLAKFSERYNIQLAQPEFNRQPHRPIPNSKALAEVIMGGGGEVYCKELGLQVDRSEGKGEIEFVGDNGKATADTVTYLFNRMPQIVAGMEASVAGLESKIEQGTTTTESRFNQFSVNFERLEIFLATMQENQNLRTHNQHLEQRSLEQEKKIIQFVEEFEKLRKQFEELETMQKPGVDGGMIYG